MMRRTEIKRTSFKRSQLLAHAYVQDREQRIAERAERAMKMIVKPGACKGIMAASTTTATPVEKECPLRSETYRRLVAALPCAYCHIEGYSQHAHENEQKGKGMKLDDRRSMPLCCARPGEEGCHTAFDQYRLLPGGRAAHVAQGRVWAEQTRQLITESGLWPKNLPVWEQGASDAT